MNKFRHKAFCYDMLDYLDFPDVFTMWRYFCEKSHEECEKNILQVDLSNSYGRKADKLCAYLKKRDKARFCFMCELWNQKYAVK